MHNNDNNSYHLLIDYHGNYINLFHMQPKCLLVVFPDLVKLFQTPPISWSMEIQNPSSHL